jgi:hypothetical protein
MNAFELIGQFRILAEQYKTGGENLPEQVIIGKLVMADNFVYHAQGGLTNKSVANILTNTAEDVITPDRTHIVMDELPANIKDVQVDGMCCKLCSPDDRAHLLESRNFRPAAIPNGHRVDIYPLDLNFKTELPIRIIYYRTPRPILFLSGLAVEPRAETGHGITASRHLTCFGVVWPDVRPSVVTSDLQGAKLSIQVNANYREDYLIEEHDSGQLENLYVNPNYVRVPYFDPNFAQEIATQDGVASMRRRAWIHRTSDLPEIYHPQIASVAAGVPPVEKAKK